MSGAAAQGRPVPAVVPPTRSPHQSPAFALFLAVLVGAAYWRGLFTFFAVDDYVYLRSTWTFWKDAVDFFVYPRGLAETLFAIHRRVFGTEYSYYHLLPLALHLINALMTHRLVRWALPGLPLAAPVAAVLFALHPAAYTPMVWLSQGFETVPCLTFTLSASHLFVRHLEQRSWTALPLSLLSMVLATAFKNNGVLIPVYLAALGWVAAGLRRTAGERTRIARRAATALIPFALFDAWFAWEVLAKIPHVEAAAYARDFAPSALAKSYGVLLVHTFNPFAVFREPLGYQLPIPAGFGADPTFVSLYRSVLAAIGLAILAFALKRGQATFVGAMLVVVVGGLAFAAPLTRHLQDYYSYFVLPASSGILALPLALLAQSRWPTIPGPARFAGAMVLVGYAVGSGTVLHAANHLVLQAHGARTVDDFVRHWVRPGQELLFVPPNGAAIADTVSGSSIAVMQPEKHVLVRFPDAGGAQTVFRPAGETMLVGLDDLDDRGARVYTLDLAQWVDLGRGPILEWDRRVLQRFAVRHDGFAEVQVRVRRSSRSCEVRASVFELVASGDPARPTRVPVGGGAGECSTDLFQVIPVAGQERSAGKIYELELQAIGKSSLSLFHVEPVPTELEPLIELPAGDGGGSGGVRPSTKALAFRVVLDGPDRLREGGHP